MTRSFHGDVTRFQAEAIAHELGGTLTQIVQPLQDNVKQLQDRVDQQNVRIRRLEFAVLALWFMQTHWFLLTRRKIRSITELARLDSKAKRDRVFKEIQEDAKVQNEELGFTRGDFDDACKYAAEADPRTLPR